MSKPKVRRHPIRGGFAGLCLGVGVVLMLFVYGVLPLSVWTLLWCTLVGIVVGIGLALLVPPRKHGRPTASPPTASTTG